MTDPIRKSEELHLGASQTPVVRIVLGEVDAPGSLHYLLESEGFLVVARASDEVELARVLEHGLDPDVVVLDTDISVESVLVARQRAPAAHIIVVWPDGVQNLPHTERIAPWLVYEQLGPAIRRAVRDRPQAHATPGPVTEERPSVSDEPIVPAADASPRRVASRVSVASIALIAVLMLTMGAAIAMDGWHVRLPWAEPRTDQAAHQAPSPNAPTAATPIADRRQHDAHPTRTRPCPPTSHARACSTRDGNHPGNNDHPGKNDHSGKNNHPGKDDHPGGKPNSSGAPTDHVGSTQPGSPPRHESPRGDTEHRPS